MRVDVARILLFTAALLGSVAPATGAELPAYVPDANAERASIPAVYHWNLAQLFADETAWEAGMVAVEKDLVTLDAYRDELSDPRHLRAALDLYFDLHDRANHCTLYANLLHETQLDQAQYTSMQSRSLALMDRVMERASFLRAEILALSSKEVEKAFRAQPELVRHRSYVENLRRRSDRVLEEEAERVLGLLGDNLWAEIDLN